MRCASAAPTILPGSKFCGECGARLANSCPKCGAENPESKKFCGECGRRLAAEHRRERADSSAPAPAALLRNQRDCGTGIGQSPEGERKTVTALFADIKGSTELMEDLDPEEARAIIDPALKLMIDAVHRYDGYVVQSTGDGIFALFGAPVAHEDHPQRALYAALRMQEELKRYSAQVLAEGGTPIQGRVGINTGEVVVRSIQTGAGQVEYTPIGHTTNLAARMQTAAPVGSIAVSEATRRLCEGYFILKPLGATKVKGVSEPVNVFEVTGLGPLRTRLQRAVGRGLTRFVGREAELAQMRRALELAREGHGQIVAAMGEPGVGKSRLFFEFKAVAQSGCLVLEAYSVSHGKASAYLPVIELLKSYFKIATEDDERATAREGDRQGRDARPFPGRHLALPFCVAWHFREATIRWRQMDPQTQAAAHPGGDQADSGAREPQPAADRRCSRTSTGSTARPRRCSICWWTASPQPASCCWSTTAPNTTINGAARPTTRNCGSTRWAKRAPRRC